MNNISVLIEKYKWVSKNKEEELRGIILKEIIKASENNEKNKINEIYNTILKIKSNKNTYNTFLIKLLIIFNNGIVI